MTIIYCRLFTFKAIGVSPSLWQSGILVCQNRVGTRLCQVSVVNWYSNPPSSTLYKGEFLVMELIFVNQWTVVLKPVVKILLNEHFHYVSPMLKYMRVVRIFGFPWYFLSRESSVSMKKEKWHGNHKTLESLTFSPDLQIVRSWRLSSFPKLQKLQKFWLKIFSHATCLHSIWSCRP